MNQNCEKVWAVVHHITSDGENLPPCGTVVLVRAGKTGKSPDCFLGYLLKHIRENEGDALTNYYWNVVVSFKPHSGAEIPIGKQVVLNDKDTWMDVLCMLPEDTEPDEDRPFDGELQDMQDKIQELEKRVEILEKYFVPFNPTPPATPVTPVVPPGYPVPYPLPIVWYGNPDYTTVTATDSQTINE